jgi:hypothetical protein
MVMKKNIEIKVSRENKVSNKKLEKLFLVVIGIMFLVLLVMSFRDYMFVSAAMIMACLECFTLGYYVRDDKSKKYLVYLLFVVGVVLLMGSIIFMLVRTV